MMNYLEHCASRENSEDKLEHIICMSFILLTFGAHIHTSTPTQHHQEKKAVLLHTFCHCIYVGEKPQ